MGSGNVPLIDHDGLFGGMHGEASQFLRPPTGLGGYYGSNESNITEEALGGALVVVSDGELVLHEVLDDDVHTILL